MQQWSLPLVASIAAFLAFLLWRIRPRMSWGRRRRVRKQALHDARTRVEAAADGRSRAVALCDAADLMMKKVAGIPSATGLYLRALRSDPQSAEIVQRVAAALSSRPRTLESLLWRHLAAAGPWDAPTRRAVASSLDALRSLYDGPLRQPVRARALANAHEMLVATEPPSPSHET